LRYLTAGESHGPGLAAILDGIPAGLEVSTDELREELRRRRRCYGRGARSDIEGDEFQITGGVHQGKTTGAPISVFIPNRDYPNWVSKHAPITAPRPGHADLAGAMKYGFLDCRPVAERASARETAARVACGYFAKKLLQHHGIKVLSWVVSIGEVDAELPDADLRLSNPKVAIDLAFRAESSPVRCPDPAASARAVTAIDAAAEAGDTIGGVMEVVAVGTPPGLGTHVQWDRRLDARLAAAIMSINGVKAVEIGGGFTTSRMRGSLAHDPIIPSGESPVRFLRPSNRAGGIEGGITNGQPVFLRAAVKPVPTLKNPLPSVDLVTGEACSAHVERSDVCIVGSAAVVAEAMIALVLADALMERYGSDVLNGVPK